MFEADGGNEIVHLMDRLIGSILAGFGTPGLRPASSRSCTRSRRTRRATSTPARRSTAGACRSSWMCDNKRRRRQRPYRQASAADDDGRPTRAPPVGAAAPRRPRRAPSAWRLAAAAVALGASCAPLAHAHEFKLERGRSQRLRQGRAAEVQLVVSGAAVPVQVGPVSGRRGRGSTSTLGAGAPAGARRDRAGPRACSRTAAPVGAACRGPLHAAVGPLASRPTSGDGPRGRAARRRHAHLHRPGLRRCPRHLSDRIAASSGSRSARPPAPTSATRSSWRCATCRTAAKPRDGDHAAAPGRWR